MGRSVETVAGSVQNVFFRYDPEPEPWKAEDIMRNIGWVLSDRYSSVKVYVPKNRPPTPGTRETITFAGNGHGEFTLSLYGGIGAVGFVPNGDRFNDSQARGLAIHWGRSIDLNGIVNEAGYETVRRVGTMSNGVGVFQS